MKSTLWQPLVWWVYAAVAVTGVCALVYITGQQNYRQNANDPQIQLAEDGAAKLEAGDVPASLINRAVPLEDLQSSLLPWVAVYDSSGLALESSAQLNGAPPKLPAGVFNVQAKAGFDDPVWKAGEYRVTWQPEQQVRQAVVLVQTTDGKYFVASGRSLKEAEIRVDQLGFLTLSAWAFTLFCLLIASFLGWIFLKAR